MGSRGCWPSAAPVGRQGARHPPYRRSWRCCNRRRPRPPRPALAGRLPSSVSCQAPGRVMCSLRTDPSVASANTSPCGPNTGELSREYGLPGHFAISRCARSYTSVGPVCGTPPQPETYVFPAASTVALHTCPVGDPDVRGENASTLWPLASMYRTLFTASFTTTSLPCTSNPLNLKRPVRSGSLDAAPPICQRTLPAGENFDKVPAWSSATYTSAVASTARW